MIQYLSETIAGTWGTLNTLIVLLPFISSIILLIFSIAIVVKINKIELEKNRTRELSLLVHDGLIAFFKKILSSTLQIIIYLIIVLLVFSFVFNKSFSWPQIIAFILGSVVMTFITYSGFIMSSKFVPRVIKKSNVFSAGMDVLFKSSIAISFLFISVVILGLLTTILFFGIEALIGYSLGVILSSFFIRIGGGMFKAGSDVGSDLLSEKDKDCPLDRRNPATLLDITGDYVGRVVGFSSDLLGSYVFSLVSCVLFAYALYKGNLITSTAVLKLIELPFFIIAIGMLTSVVAYFWSMFRIKKNKTNNIFLEGIYIAVVICGVSTFFVVRSLNIESLALTGGSKHFIPFIPYLLGLLAAILIGFTSEYMTSNRFKPARKIAEEAEYGTVVSLLHGFSQGLKSNGLFLIYVILTAILSFYFADFYGIAIAALGMLSVNTLIITSNIFAPLASNTKKLAIMAEDEDRVKNVSKIHRIGNTTAALGNGFASGAAVLSTFSFLFSLVLLSKQSILNLLLLDLPLFLGLIIGISLPFMFSGFLLSGLTKVILATMEEAARQFKEIPFLLEDKAKPDIVKAADKNARISMNALIIPGIIMALIPIVLGYLFGDKILIGLVLGAFFSGFNQSYYWANVGDSLHNAKHYIESGHFGGKDSPTFSNISCADNVGDAFKDLLSPSINIFMKSIAMIAGLVILFAI
jgi:K(+)-stimulated pyrophosphate-energized sodium pump